MIELGIVWLYLAFICLSFGGIVMGVLRSKFQIDSSHIFRNMLVGWCVITVVCEYISILFPINKVVVITLGFVAIAIDCVYLWLNKGKISIRKALKEEKYGVIILLSSLVVAYVAVTTYIAPINNPADTYGYHIQAVKWIEEFGCVKGIANLISRLGFNNSIWCFYALGSMKGVLSTRMHCALGFILALVGCYCVERIVKDVINIFVNNKRNENTPVEWSVPLILFEIALLGYVINNATTGNEFFTDQPANVLVGFILIEWMSFKKNDNKTIHKISLLSVLLVFLATIKLSMAILILLALWPLMVLIRKKDGKSIALYAGLGLFMGAPFVIRNLFITGRILYPSTALDIFNFRWKIPTPIVDIEKNLIYSFARDGSYSVEKVWDRFDYSWVLPWLGTASVADLLLVIINFAVVILMICITLNLILKRDFAVSITAQQVILLDVCGICILYWFLSAPDTRFVKVILLFLPIYVFGMLLTKKFRETDIKITQGIIFVFFCVVELICSQSIVDAVIYLDSTDNLLYLMTSNQPEFDEFEDEEYQLAGNTIYYASAPSDHELPCMSQLTKIEDIGLIGNDILEGFWFVEEGKK